MDRVSKMITALPFLFPARTVWLSWDGAARQPEMVRRLVGKGGRTCPGLTNSGQGRPAGALREESQKLQEAQLEFRTWMVLTWRDDLGKAESVLWKGRDTEVRRYGVLQLSVSLQTWWVKLQADIAEASSDMTSQALPCLLSLADASLRSDFLSITYSFPDAVFS